MLLAFDLCHICFVRYNFPNFALLCPRVDTAAACVLRTRPCTIVGIATACAHGTEYFSAMPVAMDYLCLILTSGLLGRARTFCQGCSCPVVEVSASETRAGELNWRGETQILAAHRILSAPVVAAGEGNDASETFKANSAGEEIICFVVGAQGPPPHVASTLNPLHEFWIPLMKGFPLTNCVTLMKVSRILN